MSRYTHTHVFLHAYKCIHTHVLCFTHAHTYTQRAFDSNVEMMSARMDEHVAERERSRLTRVLKSLALALKATEEIRPPVA